MEGWTWCQGLITGASRQSISDGSSCFGFRACGIQETGRRPVAKGLVESKNYIEQMITIKREYCAKYT